MAQAADSVPPIPVLVFLICRVRLYCTAIASLFGSQTAITLVGIGNQDDKVITALDAASVDVVLLDIGNAGALAWAAELIRERPHTRVLGFGVDDEPANVIACAQAGLWGYVPSTASIVELIAAARRITAGNTVCSASMAEGIFRHLRGSATGASACRVEASLTPRQQQIVRLIGDGLSNKEIARRLSLGSSTVKNHVHDILDRLQVSRRTEAVARLRHTPPLS